MTDRDNKTLPEVVRLFITRARDKYGLGRFMPDELPLLNEMARLCAVESPVTSDVPKGTAYAEPTGPPRTSSGRSCARAAARSSPSWKPRSARRPTTSTGSSSRRTTSAATA